MVPFYLMMTPGLLYFLINNYLPMAGITVAFRKVNYKLGLFKSPWCGFDNFEFLFASGQLGTMIRNLSLIHIFSGSVKRCKEKLGVYVRGIRIAYGQGSDRRGAYVRREFFN